MDDSELKSRGLTDAGAAHFRKTTIAYEEELLRRSLRFAEAQALHGQPVEATPGHVQAAATEISRTLISKKSSLGVLLVRAFQFIFSVMAGVGVSLATSGGSELKVYGGAITLVVGIASYVVLLFVEAAMSARSD